MTVLMIEPQADVMLIMRHCVLALLQAATSEAPKLSSNVWTLAASDKNPQPTVGLLTAFVAKYTSTVSTAQSAEAGAGVGSEVVAGDDVGVVDRPHSTNPTGHILVCGSVYQAQMPLCSCLQLPSDPPLQSSMAQRAGVVVAVVVAVVDAEVLPVEV